MRALGELLSYAHKEETRIRKEELEKRLFPLWLANYTVAKLTGADEVMDFEEFINTTLSDKAAPKAAPKKEKTAEDIMAELMPLVEADKQRGG